MAKQNLIAIAYNKRGCVVAVGRNSYEKTHPFQAKYASKTGCPEAVYLHAEIALLLRLLATGRAKTVARIEVKRLKADGSMGLARPCPACAKALTDHVPRAKLSWTVDASATVYKSQRYSSHAS